MSDPLVCSIATTTHGRYLVSAPSRPGPHPLLVGFHGYGENAERHLDQLRRIPAADAWRLVAVQGLHRFYTGKMEDIAASWMTRQDREQAIEDNLAYVNAVVHAVTDEHATSALVFAGFSQGVAMAYRAAAFGDRRADGVVALGGDLPPDVRDRAAARLPPVLIGRGTGDTWYTQQKLAADVADLRAAGVQLETLVYDGGHEWTDTFRQAAGAFLRQLDTWGRD
ncbi:MAG: alpha/beta hydrolase [Bacteroidales bacterium]